ncbi:MAG: GntR family transcriptional regulator [Verrucomicrobia bacterium]|nr:MAG: GntR family transcriptional regulator [Verrucomicrobiota bacterium]
MAMIGKRETLQIVRETRFGLFLAAGELGEVLLPRKEVPVSWAVGNFLNVFLYHDSEDRPVATLLTPKVMPGHFAKLRCVAVTGVGAFLDWGLAKDLLVPFREQKVRMELKKFYVVYVQIDEHTDRIVATTRLSRHLDQTPVSYQIGQLVDLIIFGKTALGYKAIINGAHSGLLFADGVYQPLQLGESVQGYISALREDGKVDLTLHPPGRARVENLESRILAELEARGGFWAIGDHSSAEQIHDELGVSKRTFKQTLGAMLKKRSVSQTAKGIRLLNE